MDCKIYLLDGREIALTNVNNIRAVPNVDNPGIATISVYDKDKAPEITTHPIAAFYNAVGYELVNRK